MKERILKFLQNRWFILIAGVILGIAISTVFKIDMPFIKIGQHVNRYFNSFEIAPAMLSDIITFEAVLIGIAIPLSTQVVITIVKDYDREISTLFIKEPLYVLQFGTVFLSIIFSLLLKSYAVESGTLLSLSLYWSIINIFLFVAFIFRVNKYVTKTDKVLISKLEDRADEIFKK